MSVGERQHVTIAGMVQDLRAGSAYDWIMAYSRDPKTLTWIVPGMLEDVDTAFADFTGVDDIGRRWLNCARVVLERESGRDWWRAGNLIDMILGSWTVIHGSLLLAGCDPRRMCLSAWLDAAYVDIMRRTDDDNHKNIEMELNKAPIGVHTKSTNAQKKKDLAAFAAD